jgi:dTDP-4-dehydrorhamnose 3,5-epimerase
MQTNKTIFEEVVIMDLKAFGDARGFFRELYRVSSYQDAGILPSFVQFNHSRSVANVLRGLHFQLKHPQGKLVTVTRGAILDVVADIRVGSPTFGKWIAEEISDSNHKQIYIPPGFAHGVLMLSETVDLLYQCTDYYHPEDEYSIAWNDPTLNIEWPVQEPALSAKDLKGPFLKDMSPEQLPQYSPSATEVSV